MYARFSGGHENIRINAFRAARRRRRHHHDLRHPGNLCRYHVHQHRGRVGRLAAGNIDAHALQRADDLAENRAVGLQIHPGIAFLPRMERTDIHGCCANCRHEGLLYPAIGGLKLLRRYAQLRWRQCSAVEALRIPEQRRVAFPLDIGHDFTYGLVLLRRAIFHLTLQLKFLTGLDLHRRFPLELYSFAYIIVPATPVLQ